MSRMILLAAAGLSALSIGGAANAQTRIPEWGARAAAKCPSVRQLTPAAATQLVRCALERQSTASGESWLVEDLQVQVGGSTPFAAVYNSYNMPDADTTKRAFPIRGGFTWSVCILRADAKISGNADRNCRETPVTDAKGVCWQTTFGDWRCTFSGTSGASRRNLPPR